MRVFYSYRSRAASLLAALFIIASHAGVFPRALSAQWPGEIEGKVVDLLSGAGVQGAQVEIEGTGEVFRASGTAEFRVRSLDPGEYRVSASAPGYARTSQRVQVRNGAVAHVVLELPPEALPLEGIGVEVERGRPGSQRIGRAEVMASGARTVDELLQHLSGVTVQRRGPGGPTTVSLRGSEEDAVLVLVDGIPLNDPITGEADLSALSTSGVRELTVITGASSARYGGRAMGGVVLVETGGGMRGVASRLSTGSLGQFGGDGEVGAEVGGFTLGAAGEWMAMGGGFGFEQPDEVGGGAAVRENADFRRGSLRVSLARDTGGGALQTHVHVESLERGLPGKSFAPSRHARQETTRARAGGTWTRSGERGSLRLALSGTVQEVGHRDPDPPFGLPYDDHTRLDQGTLRLEGERWVRRGARPLRVSAGFDVDRQAVGATALSDLAASSRLDLGVWSSSTLQWEGLPGRPELTGTLRMQRDGLLDERAFSHDLTLGISPGSLHLYLAHRSAYSPPTVGDQFFREGVAVAPNPDLRAERIPGEWELTGSGEAVLGGLDASARASLFRADVRGMIVWSPDYRFVWSPRNVDVNRRGAEVRGEVRHRSSGLSLSGSYTLARVTYDRDDPDPVQVIYRPRHTGSFRAGWENREGWGALLEGRYVGTRYPVPAPVNALPAFWSYDLVLRGRFSAGGWRFEPFLRVDRILDRRDSFIFAFPEPGRSWRLELRIGRSR